MLRLPKGQRATACAYFQDTFGREHGDDKLTNMWPNGGVILKLVPSLMQQIHLISQSADPQRAAKLAAFDRILTIMDELREQCPWDKKQTWESLRHLTIEETYELSEAIMGADPKEVMKEAGDLLLHLVFYARIASETQQWGITEMIDSLCEKLINRHPHIYGDVVVADEAEVKRNWEALKKKEGNESALGGVPKGLPALVKAMRIQEKARGAGFDWDMPEQVWEKVQEELAEFKEVADAGLQTKMVAEFGDVLFSLVNFARFKGINPDEALEATNRKFIFRFRHMEAQAAAAGLELAALSLPQMETWWNEAKGLEKQL